MHGHARERPRFPPRTRGCVGALPRRPGCLQWMSTVNTRAYSSDISLPVEIRQVAFLLEQVRRAREAAGAAGAVPRRESAAEQRQPLIESESTGSSIRTT